MLRIGFLNHYHLVQRECINAFLRVNDISLIVIDIVENPSPLQIQTLVSELAMHKVQCVFTINEWGLDTACELATILTLKNILHVNWFVDDPFFFEIMYNIPLVPTTNRIDFVSDRGYVKALCDRDFNAHFLPLATDPTIFKPKALSTPLLRSTCFVGNSYKAELDGFLCDFNIDLNPYIPDVLKLLSLYSHNMQTPLNDHIQNILIQKKSHTQTDSPKVAFLLKFFIGYIFRKQLVINLAKKFSDCIIFGDPFWVPDIQKERVSTAVGYYHNLCETYQTTAVNVDINRTVIVDGFTQRIFDCSASGSFIITTPKPCVHEYFETSGSKQEVAVVESTESFLDMVSYYVSHEAERNAIAQRAMQKVCLLHTYENRIKTLLTFVAKA